ncbi:MAG TPA: MarR family transcriptional regulator [Actinomycetota bacterium]|nr:MarR family transcriptional regulator [Actinomycetota bacterium]
MTDIILRQDVGELGPVIGRLRRALKRRLGTPSLLPDSHVEIARLLYEHPDLKVQEVAAALRLAPNTVSTLVQQLVRDGNVERETDEDDRRVARLRLTPAMRKRISRRRDERRAILEEAIGSLSQREQATIEAAIPALMRLTEVLEGSP